MSTSNQESEAMQTKKLETAIELLHEAQLAAHNDAEAAIDRMITACQIIQGAIDNERGRRRRWAHPTAGELLASVKSANARYGLRSPDDADLAGESDNG